MPHVTFPMAGAHRVWEAALWTQVKKPYYLSPPKMYKLTGAKESLMYPPSPHPSPKVFSPSFRIRKGHVISVVGFWREGGGVMWRKYMAHFKHVCCK